MRINPKTKLAVLERDEFTCVLNGPGCSRVADVADHRANRGSGGSKVLNEPECLIAACVLCNGGKEDADGPYRLRLIARGIRVVKRATNAQTVERCRQIPVLYADGWHRLEGINRVPVKEADALEYMRLIHAIPADGGVSGQQRRKEE